MSTLREATLKLAQERPELRRHLLPLLRKTGAGETDGETDGKTAMASATVESFLTILEGRLTQYDQKLERKQPNAYRLSHFLEAVQETRKMVGRYLQDDSPEAMAALQDALGQNFIMVGRRFDLPPVNAVVKMMDAWSGSGKMPKYAWGDGEINDPRGGWDEILAGDKARIRWKGHPSAYMVIEELPSKGKKRLKRATYSVGDSLLTGFGQSSPNRFMMENLLMDAKLSKSMTYDQAVKAMDGALQKALAGWKKDIADGKTTRWEPAEIPDWFYRSLKYVPDVEEVFYLTVEPKDYAPVEVEGKNFSLKSEWGTFEADLHIAGAEEHAYGGDPHYIKMNSKSQGGARKLFKALKANPDVLKGKTWEDLQAFLSGAKIGFETAHSQWH